MFCRHLAVVLCVSCVGLGIAPRAVARDHSPTQSQQPILQLPSGDEWTQSARVTGMAKADRDSIYLLGGPGRFDGRFEDQFGNPSWQGWTHEDLTETACMWQVSEFQALAGQYSAWCGTYFGDDPGYGNDWYQRLLLRHQVPDPGASSTVHWTALLRVDTEPFYDFVHLAANLDGAWQDQLVQDGEATLPVDITVTYQPGDYVGPNHDEIQLRIQFVSDGAWSDEDGLWNTDGACQVDDIVVAVNGAVVSSEDCEDGVLDDWECEAPPVGDFAALYLHLDDLDPCVDNHSPQVAFIDDGVVVPGTGGSFCTTWCYGPNGYIVNNTGGLLGPDAHIENRIVSPVMTMPADADGLELRADIYRHEEMGNPEVWPGIAFGFQVRSTGDPVGAPLAEQPWWGGNTVYWGGPDYHRYARDLTEYLEPGCVQVQVALFVREAGWLGGVHGVDGTPAPYFDNVACVAYRYDGPLLVPHGIRGVAGSAFPESGELDLVDLANNSVRFDVIGLLGDSLIFDAEAVRAGAVLAGPALMHVCMQANPVFDPVRQVPAGFVQQGAIIRGLVHGDSVYDHSQQPPVLVPGRFAFDLPDTGFFFPGDEIHYCVEARDDLAGDVGIAQVPADTSGFSDFGPISPYERRFCVRALPTLRSPTPGDQPTVIFWQEATSGTATWQYVFANLGWELGVDFDWFDTKGFVGWPTGLGDVATSALLSGYRTLIFDAGSNALGIVTERDVQVLGNWFQRGDPDDPRCALMMGDDLVAELSSGGAEIMGFMNTYIPVAYLDADLVDLVDNQRSPHVRPIPGNGFVTRVDEWIAYGGCRWPASMDAIAPAGSSVRIAEFLDPSGNAGVYPIAAGIFHQESLSGAKVVLLPYPLPRIVNAPGHAPPPGYDGISARAIILEDIMTAFGELHQGQPNAAPLPAALSVRVAPNPFNPRTTIVLTLPRPGDVTVKLYSVRGELVRTLITGRLAAGKHDLVWDGAMDSGQPVGSGVYFCETKALGETRVSKLALVR